MVPATDFSLSRSVVLGDPFVAWKPGSSRKDAINAWQLVHELGQARKDTAGRGVDAATIDTEARN